MATGDYCCELVSLGESCPGFLALLTFSSSTDSNSQSGEKPHEFYAFPALPPPPPVASVRARL